jgi:hypothetical protein
MATPTEQVDPSTRKLGKSKRRRRKHKVGRRQTDTKPSSAGPPSQPLPKKIFGHYKPPPPPPQRRALDWQGLRERGYLRRLWNRGDFPKPFKPSPRRLAWWSDEIDAWLEAAAVDNTELPAEAAAVADSEVDLHAAMRALERRCRALELELQKAKKHKPGS